jgi:WhiB family redox-sensing transcriptional regulator
MRRLPGPVADLWEWQYAAACRGREDLFFTRDGERGRSRRSRETAAKEICRTCPVVTQCQRHALRTREEYGVWGGLSEADRHALLPDRLRATG